MKTVQCSAAKEERQAAGAVKYGSNEAASLLSWTRERFAPPYGRKINSAARQSKFEARGERGGVVGGEYLLSERCLCVM